MQCDDACDGVVESAVRTLYAMANYEVEQGHDRIAAVSLS